MLFSSLLLLGLGIPAVLADQHGRVHHARHHELAQRDPGEMEMFKRFSNSRWSFYDAGLGACGKVNSGADYIVALNAAQFGNGYPGPNCFKFIRMTWKGVSVRAQIVDRCPGCPFGGLDLTRGLFGRFADLGKGIIDDGQWTFEGAEPPKPPPTPKPSPTTRTTQRPTSTRTRTPTSTRTSTRTTRTSSSSTSTSESESASSTSSSATTPAPTDDVVSEGDADAPGNGPQFLAESNQAILGAGQFLAAVVFSAGKQ